jgi:hypothetical protein
LQLGYERLSSPLVASIKDPMVLQDPELLTYLSRHEQPKYQQTKFTDVMNMICDIYISNLRYTYISQGEQHMNTHPLTTSNSRAKIVAAQDSSEATIKDLAEKLAAQSGENQRLMFENRILWDLLLFDGVK